MAPRFEIQTTDNCRGYVARGKIVNDRLWLAGVKGQLESEEEKSVDWSSASEREATPTKRPSWTRWLGRYSPPTKALSALDEHRITIKQIEALAQGPNGTRLATEKFKGSSISASNGVVDRALARGIRNEEILHSETKPFLASWYSGLLRIPLGELLSYVHLDFYSLYETDLIMEIEAGVARRRWQIDNRSACPAQKRKDDFNVIAGLKRMVGNDEESRRSRPTTIKKLSNLGKRLINR